MLIDYGISLVHTSLFGDADVESKCRGQVISVSLREIQTYFIHIPDDMKHINSNRFQCCTDTVQFNALCYISDP